MRWIWALISLVLIGSVFSSSYGETPDFENCQGFLSEIEIKDILQYDGDLEIILLSLKAENTHIRTICSLTVSTPDKSDTISMEVVVFSGSSPALKHYGMLLDSAKNQNVEIYEGKNPWKFFSAELNQGGIGKTVVSQRDVYVLSLNTVETTTSKFLPSEGSLQDLSLLVQQKIIPLATGSYTQSSLPKAVTKPEVKESFAEESSELLEDILSPKQQVKDGIAPEYIICKNDLQLIIKNSDNSPACVKPSSAQKLIERGWATPN